MQAAAGRTVFPDASVWAEAYSLQTRHSLSTWDALLVAACIVGRIDRLYTEDMGSPRTIDGLSLVNPFLAKP